jgi:hypothetical protein
MSDVEEKEARRRIRSDWEYAILLVRSEGAWLPMTLAASEDALGLMS